MLSIAEGGEAGALEDADEWYQEEKRLTLMLSHYAKRAKMATIITNATATVLFFCIDELASKGLGTP